MILNNGNNLVKKFEQESFSEDFAVGRLDENGVLESPNIKHNSTFITDLFDSNQNVDNQSTITENATSLMASSLANFIKNNNIEPEMRLYGIGEIYFETMDELLKYCRQNQCSTQYLVVLDYYRNFYDHKDVIRKTNSEISMFYAISNEHGYVWYGDELNMFDENWEFNHGQISSLYKPFREHGIVFEDDIYAKESERTQQILKYCREKNLFNMSKKQN